MAGKALMGPKIRRLRRDEGLTQARMAERLGISPSYLNLIENNQRSVTVDLLLRIGQTFNVDLQTFAEDDATRLIGALEDALGDALPEGPPVGRQDLVDLVTTTPAAGRAMLALYTAYKKSHDEARLLADQRITDGPADGSVEPPPEQVRDFLHARGNHFPGLEAAAEEDWRIGELDFADLYHGLIRFLDSELSLRVKVLPVDVMGTDRRRYDRHGRRILLSEMLGTASRCFQLAVQIALIRHDARLRALVADSDLRGDDARALARHALASYFAGAMLLPYDRIYRAAQAVRYDLDILQRRFGVGLETVAHRLTTLQRPGARGVPFFMMRLDPAGNVSKRYSADGSHFARVGGACPRWSVHDAFRGCGRILTQVVELPDGQRFFTLAASVSRPSTGHGRHGPQHVIVLGCDIEHAAQLVYADGVAVNDDDITEPVGTHCRLCERPDCAYRAFPPIGSALAVNDMVRPASPYAFEPA